MTNPTSAILCKQTLSLGTLVILLTLAPAVIALYYGDAPKDLSIIDADMANAYPTLEVEDYRVAMALPEPEICRSGLLSGDFEGLPRAFSMEDVIPGWSIKASDPAAKQRNVSGFVSRNSIEIWPSGFLGVPAYEGDRFAEINAHVAGAMYQDMQTTPGAVVNYKFAHRGRGGDDTIDVLIGSPNNTISQTDGEGYTTGRSEWKTYGGTYVVPRGQYITRFSFEALRTGSRSNSVGNFIDVVEFGFECDEDYGDAPAVYGVPRHIIGPSFYMGESEPDVETTEQPSADADSDDLIGEDDEDGVFIPTLIRGESAKIIVKVTGKNGYLQGWVDWNGDGDFNDTVEGVAEQIIIDARDNKTSSSARSNDSDTEEGQITINITVPTTVSEDNTYARFRWSDTKSLKSTGAARNGEVEDYAFTISQDKMNCTANDLAPGSYSMGALSINATNMTTDTLLYQGSFDNRNWTGDVTAYSLKTDDSDGNVKSVVWRASNKISRKNRRVFTYNPVLSSDRGTSFDWNNLNDSQKTYLRLD